MKNYLRKEKNFKINGVEYLAELIPKVGRILDCVEEKGLRKLALVLGEAERYISVNGEVEYIKEGVNEIQTGKFLEQLTEYREYSDYNLSIVLNDNPPKKIEIHSVVTDDRGKENIYAKAYEKRKGFFARWKDIPLEEIS
ncbi:MAG: hypothetical protein PHQ66_02320 [Candidatus Nanoarchaeia archaeon]|nr:hypothetical protein [Candidatus Nanoarchaeia archaeon]MDD5357795.1 hypothetical protein [Candidatus Nanoarchaeia archaeon]MDD5588714.1 hypothetical protein [Candidatus Nanoarchaeia archaeon]